MRAVVIDEDTDFEKLFDMICENDIDIEELHNMIEEAVEPKRREKQNGILQTKMPNV
jgi:hypothetical protein